MRLESGGESEGSRARGAVRVACLMGDPETARLVEQLLRIWVPEVEIADELTGAVRGVPAVDAVLLDAPDAGEIALDRLRRIRASGFAGAVVVVALHMDESDGGGASKPSADWKRLGGALCPLATNAGARLATVLADALDDADAARGVGEAGTPTATLLRREVGETRRLVAVAEVALRLQHSLNNPLAALMAEAQLLEMEQLLPEQRTAVRRMVELCRRMSATLRTLDVARDVEWPDREALRGPAWLARGGG
ncbi:MAG TPA: histidine kinase dimerization/phospho-acceptor domain-containing protein [Gemmatimonadales bacterium]